MKLSVETKVATAVAAGFIALTAGAIVQGSSGDQTGGPNNYNPANNPGLNTHMSQAADNSSLFGRTNAEENMQRVSDQDVTDTISKKDTKSKTGKSRKHHTNEQAQRNQ
ncbi:MAG: hypothetical protein WA849_05075 [Candidatus Udaeobacter sp.]